MGNLINRSFGKRTEKIVAEKEQNRSVKPVQGIQQKLRIPHSYKLQIRRQLMSIQGVRAEYFSVNNGKFKRRFDRHTVSYSG